jgi:hypothetical protein
MMRAKGSAVHGISPLVPKNHFASVSLFREEPLVRWPYTDTVLFTAYDVYRSSDFWLDSVVKSGMTLKEGLVSLGFPKDNKIIADTGIFELEAKKAGIAADLGIEVAVHLTNDQIFEAYELSGADFFVAPDEIILATDDNASVIEKTSTIKSNMQDLLKVIPPSKTIGVLQGIEPKIVANLFDFYKEQGIDKFAIGGLIPLYRYDKMLFGQVIRHVRELTQGYWLHTFGLPTPGLIPYYLQEVGMDSVDTSTLLYLTARKRYLTGVNARPVRLVDFGSCRCEGCRNLNTNMSPLKAEFFVNLYIHNITEASNVAKDCIQGTWKPDSEDNRVPDRSSEVEVLEHQQEREGPLKHHIAEWVTADKLLSDDGQ